MFNFTKKRKEESICYCSCGKIGGIHLEQPPMKRKPFASVLDMPYVHKLDLIMQKDAFDTVKEILTPQIQSPGYQRVIMPLSGLVDGDFFTEYIKKGNILMLSEGQHGVDNVYYLRQGILTLTLDKESFERAGLNGKPDGAKAKRGTRPRWIVEINLRLPSMLHGKKGFDRIVYAFKNALPKPVSWLFQDLDPTDPTSHPIDHHFPVNLKCPPRLTERYGVKVPVFETPEEGPEDFRVLAADLHEWLSLVSLQSPRLDSADCVDPFISRYETPGVELSQSGGVEIVTITWTGFLSSIWAHKCLVLALSTARSDAWLAISVCGFHGSLSGSSKDCTVLKLPGISREYFLWDIEHS